MSNTPASDEHIDSALGKLLHEHDLSLAAYLKSLKPLLAFAGAA